MHSPCILLSKRPKYALAVISAVLKSMRSSFRVEVDYLKNFYLFMWLIKVLPFAYQVTRIDTLKDGMCKRA